MRLKHGTTSEPEVRIRDSQEGEWRDTGTTRPTPDVPGQCSAAWEDGDVIAIACRFRRGRAADCGVEVDTSSSTLIIEAPGLEGNVARVKLPEGADEDSIAVKLSKKPTRTLVVRVPDRRAPLAVPPSPHTVESPPPRSLRPICRRGRVSCDGSLEGLRRRGRDALVVVVHGLLDASVRASARTRHGSARHRPEGRLRLGGFHTDQVGSGWQGGRTAGVNPARVGRAELPRHPGVVAAAAGRVRGVGRARRKKTRTDATRTDAMFANLGDETAGTTPVVVVIAGASSFTEQHLLDRTRYWEEVTVAAPQPAGGIHLAFVGGRRMARVVEAKRLSPTITASVHRETVRRLLHGEVPNDVPLMIVGFNTGMGGGGGALARGWAPDLVETLSRRPDAPAVFTAANDYADLGANSRFSTLGARFIVNPRANPFRTFTHTRARAGW